MSRRKLVAAVLSGGLAAFLGLWLVPAASSDLGPATVRVRAHPGTGNTHLLIPPLGSITARTQISPITLEMSLQEVDVEQLGPLATTPHGRVLLQREVENDLRGLIVKSALQLGAGMLLLGVLAGIVLFRHQLRPTLFAGAGALVVAVGLFAATSSTYDVNAFEEPRFTGSLQRARGVIDALQANVGLLDEARTRYEVASQRAADLITMLGQSNPDPQGGTTAILHVSDIHGNPIGLDVTEELAREFGVDAIVDTGDLASSTFDTGELSSLSAPLERSMIKTIGRLPAPYIFVAGNHDSFDLRDQLRGAANVEYLDRDSTFVGSLELFGWADPTYTPEDVSGSDKADERLEEADDVAAAVAAATPDVLLVHDQRLASESYEEVPLILGGHMHARSIEELETTTILTVGSTGATGLKAFTVEADNPYEAEIIYFEGDDLIAVDYVKVGALGSEFELERTILADPEEES